jgi:hypothetical protein
MRHHPGEVWFLPPDAREGGDPKARRHVLLGSDNNSDIAIFAFASQQGTEAAFGAANVLLDPFATRYGRSGRTGFDHPTYVYPSRLVPVAFSELRTFKGRIIDEMAEIRSKLPLALGIGAGSSEGSGAASGSWRGRVVQFSDAFARELECSHGLVVTDPAYSNAQRYQTVVPILDPEEFETSGSDLVVAGQPWIALVDIGLEAVWLAVDMVQSVFHPTDIARWTGATADEGTIAEVDTCLLHLFGL